MSQRISRGVISVRINRCFLHFTGQQGMFGPGKGINLHHKCCFSSSSYCVDVQTFSSQRILCCTSPSTNTGSLHGKCCRLLLPTIPLPPFARNCPSFLSPRSDGADEPLINGDCAAQYAYPTSCHYFPFLSCNNVRLWVCRTGFQWWYQSTSGSYTHTPRHTHFSLCYLFSSHLSKTPPWLLWPWLQQSHPPRHGSLFT